MAFQIASYMVGVYEDMTKAAKRFTTVTQAVQPREANQEFYECYADFYCKLLGQMDTTLNGNTAKLAM